MKVLIVASVASMIDQFNMPNIRLLLEMGYEVDVVCNFKEGNTCDARRIRKLQKALDEMCVVWHQWDCPRNIDSIKKCCKAYKQLWKLTDRFSYEGMHCHSPVGGVLARLIAHRRKIPVAYTAHGFHFYWGAPLKNWLLYYPVEKLLSYWTDVLITVNQEDYQLARKKLNAKRVCHIPGVGIDVKKLAKHPSLSEEEKKIFRRHYHIPEDAILLLSVGELNKGKNHQMVISALAALKRQDIYYMICGQGVLKNYLRKYAERMDVSNRICMPGYQENMPWIYQNADIFVFPSMREGMPVALMEAMAAGLPCVASNIRGNRELVDEAMRFSLKKPAQLLKVLERLLQDELDRAKCGMQNKKKIRSYGQAAVSKKMRKIYRYLFTQ